MGTAISTLRRRLSQPTTSSVVAKFRRPEYLNWLKAGQGLKCCGEGLIDFCVDVVNRFHRSLIVQHGNATCPLPNITKEITLDRGSRSWKVNCTCGVCDAWLGSIASQLATGQFCWKNTDVQDWPLHPWQMAKVFMCFGKHPTSYDPADTDTAGFLQLILNCRVFAGMLDAAKVNLVRQVRNDIMHSSNLELTSVDLSTYLDKMVNLLQETGLQNYASAQRAVVEINKIKDTPLDVNLAEVRELENSIWREMIEEKQTSNKEDILLIIASNKDLQDRLGDDYTRLKSEVEGVKRDVDDVRADVEDVKLKVQVLELKGANKTISKRTIKSIKASVKKQLRAKYRNVEKHATEVDRFIELRLQKFQQEALPESLAYRDVEELERRRRSSPVVPASYLLSELEDGEVAPRKVLIRGRAGVGKTTLVEYLAREWATQKLWLDVKYVFVVKLRELLGNEMWTLSDVLLDDLQLTKHEKSAVLDEICRNSEHVLVFLDGLDEYAAYQHSKGRFPIEDKVNLSVIISSIISCSLLPQARVIITSRHTDQIPSKAFNRVVDVYGFTKDGILQYVDKFCAGNEKLKQFIQMNINTNPTMATFCHTPVQCCFICRSLADRLENSESESMPEIRTMTQLYVKATHRLGQKLHPSLKYDETDPSLERIFNVLKKPLLKHAALAKDCMTNPLKLIFYDDDLNHHGFDDEDKRTGFLSGSKKTNPHDNATKINTWSFSHLSLQEFFASLGLLQGPCADVWLLLENTLVKQNEIVLTFLTGLLGDPSNAYYLKYLGSTQPSLDFCKEFIMKLKDKLKGDPFKMVTLMYETQCKDFVDNVPEELRTSHIYPTEMLSLCWVVVQDTCRVTSLSLNRCRMDIHLVKQLCDALARNSTIQELDLGGNRVFAQDEARQALGAALAGMPQMRRLKVMSCYLTEESWRHIVNGICQGCNQLERLNCQFNYLTDAGSEKTTKHLLTQLPHLVIEAHGCGLSEQSGGHLQTEFGGRFILIRQPDSST